MGSAYRHRKETAACDYLEHHGIVGFMHFLMQSLMKDKPDEPYAFLMSQIQLRMDRGSSKEVTGQTRAFEPSSDIAASGDAPEATVRDVGIERLLHKLDPEASSVVTADLAELERGTAEASDRLRKENSSLRECADQLKSEYERLVDANTRMRHQQQVLSPIPSRTQTPIKRKEDATVTSRAGAGSPSSPSLEAYREIAAMQEEVTQLARENGELVMQLGKMRYAIDTLRRDMEQQLQQQQYQDAG